MAWKEKRNIIQPGDVSSSGSGGRGFAGLRTREPLSWQLWRMRGGRRLRWGGHAFRVPGGAGRHRGAEQKGFQRRSFPRSAAQVPSVWQRSVGPVHPQLEGEWRPHGWEVCGFPHTQARLLGDGTSGKTKGSKRLWHLTFQVSNLKKAAV